MANEYARNIQDAALNPVAFALPNAASSSTTSAAVDFGTDTVKPETIELDLAVPALSDTILPNTKTATVLYESSTTSNFVAVARQLASITLTGAGAGSTAMSLRTRLPSNCERYVRGKVTLGANTTDGSAVNATLTLRF